MSDIKKDDLFEQYGFSADESKSSVPDFGGFMAGDPVAVDETTVDTVEEYIAPAGEEPEETDPNLNYMANMQNMFKSLSQDDTVPEEAPAADAVSDPEPELSSYLLGKPGDVPVKSQTDLLSAETRPFRGAPTEEVHSEGLQAEEKGAAAEPGTAGSEQQMSTPKKRPVEKGDEYWSFVDSLLDNFDDTKVNTPRPRTPVEHVERAPRVTAEEAAAAVATATAPVVDREPAVPTTRASEASAAEAKSSGEAPAAGGYFMPRAKGEQAKKARSHRGFHLSETDETVLPEVPETPVVEEAAVEAPVVEAAVEVPETPAVEEAAVETPVVETPVVEATVPEVDIPEEPAVEAPAEPEAPKEENTYFKKTVETPAVEDFAEPDVEFAPVSAETEVEAPAVSEPVVTEPVEAPVAEPVGLSREERKAQKQAEKEARKAEKLAAKEAKAAEKEAAKAARQAEKDGAFPWEEDAAGSRVSLEEALEGKASADAPVLHEERSTLAAAPAAAAVADFDANARNAEFDATYVEPKKGGALKVLRNIIITLAALAIVACIALLGYRYAQQKINIRQFEQANNLVVEGLEQNDMDAVRKKYPNVKFPAEISPAFGELYAQNQDLTGWIRVPGTNIGYPVVQTDNDTFYQNHNFKKTASPYGTPFLSTKNDAKELDLNTVVYGQNSENDPRVFGELDIYRNKAGFLTAPILEYSTLTNTYQFKVYGVFISNAAPEQDNGYVFDYTVPNLGTVESFAGYIDQINQRRLYDTGVNIKSTDKLLTLSTSAGDFDGARLVVVGRLLRDGESATIKQSKVKVNKSPRYPQAYYDANGKENPYKDADNWVPTVS